MGIWIRSQDRRTLIKSEDIQISGTSLITMIKYSVIELGIYSSIEKTLKVLDMMENFINNLEKYVIESDNYSDVHSLRKVVTNSIFQMPLDNEVE